MSVEGKELVAQVRDAARAHNMTWEAMVPDAFTVDVNAEGAEEQAHRHMAGAKARLREHICTVYGISIRELSSLAMP